MVLFAPPANDTPQDLPATFMVAQSMGDFALEVDYLLYFTVHYFDYEYYDDFRPIAVDHLCFLQLRRTLTSGMHQLRMQTLSLHDLSKCLVSPWILSSLAHRVFS